MSTAPAIVFPTVLNNPNLAQVSYAALTNVPEFEADAWEHWVFDKNGAADLTGRVNSRALTPVATAPTYNTKSLTVAIRPNALNATLVEPTARTLCMVLKHSAQATIFGGTVGSSDGASPLFNGTSYGSLVRGYGTTTRAMTLSPAPSAGDVVFFACALDLTGKVRRHVLGSQTQELTDDTGAFVASTRAMSLGNASFNNVTYNAATPEFYEVALFNSALTLADIAAVYARAKVRMARRGVTVS